MLALGLARLTAARLPLLQISAFWVGADMTICTPNIAFSDAPKHFYSGGRPNHLDER
jgi:hypothetical protein